MSYTPQSAEVPSSRTITTTAPITGGGDLSTDRTLAIPKATLTVDGYLAATDFTTFNSKMTGNTAITGATKTKITYDTKGLVTAGADATTADIADSTDRRYVTDAQRTVIGNTSGTNTGDQDLSGYVPTSRTVNGHALTSNVTVTKSDVSLGSVDNLQQAPITRTISTTAPITGGGDLSGDRTLAMAKSTASVDGYLAAADFTTFNAKVSATRAVNTTAPVTGGGDLSADRTIAIPKATTSVDGYLASADFTTFNNKQAALGYTPENVANKTTDGTLAANSDTLYPSEKAVKTYADTKQTALGYTAENTANKNAASGYAGLDASSKLTGSQQTYGSTANTACEGSDTRLRTFMHAFAFMGS